MTNYETFMKHKAQKRILELKKLLSKFDYISNKFAEAEAIYLITNDKTKLEEAYNQYKDLIEERDNIRKEINELE